MARGTWSERARRSIEMGTRGDQLMASELARRAGEYSDDEMDEAADLELEMWEALSDDAADLYEDEPDDEEL